MKRALKTAITLTAIGIAVRANRRLIEYKQLKEEYIQLAKAKLDNQPR